VDDVGLHTDRSSGAMELVVQVALIERGYEYNCVWLVKKEHMHCTLPSPRIIFPPQRCGSRVAVVFQLSRAPPTGASAGI